MAFFQILYDQYHIWHIFKLSMKSKVFCRIKLNDQPSGKGNHSAKMGADSLVENTQNTRKCIWPICPLCQNFSDINEKGFIGHL